MYEHEVISRKFPGKPTFPIRMKALNPIFIKDTSRFIKDSI